MDITNTLSSFFERRGECFRLLQSNEQFFGRLSQGKSDMCDCFELVTHPLKGFKLSKDMTVLCRNQKFIVTAVTEYTLNGKPLYCHAFLQEIGAEHGQH